MTRRAAAFVDRDGTIIHDTGYPRNPEIISLLPGAVEGIRELQQLGFLIVIVSNQSGVGRGWISESAAVAVHHRTKMMVESKGVKIDEWAYCFHTPDDRCNCRKPNPGMLLEVARRLDIDLASSVAIGDSDRDISAGTAAGCGHTFKLDYSSSAEAGAWQSAIDDVSSWWRNRRNSV